ncbi:MAG: (2Fe-2S) ferredoxin domain-containing protein [Elusimicrobia bacterium]|nr:(2Fe-2S) ferredoxin domain-containing protein [Elusimicrobiota bacterium]
MEKKSVPFEKTVFVCTNVREGKAACANPGAGGDEICRALKEAVKEAGLKSKIRVARSGCLDRCAEGPNLFVYPSGEWYSKVAPEDVPALVKKLSDRS